MVGNTLAGRGRARRGAMAIMAGTASGQLLALAASPVLSRLYTPADFGVFAVVSGLAMILGTAMAMRYEMAIPLPADDEDARTLVLLGALVTIGTTVVTTIAFWLWAPAIADLVGMPAARPWLVLAPAIAGAIAAFQLLNAWALRHQRYSATARRNVVTAVTTVTVQLLGGWRIAGPGGLVAGLASGQALGAASLISRAGLAGRVRRSDLRRLGRRYRRFPLMLAPAGLLNASGLYVPVLLVAALYGAEQAGWLGFTQRILSLPVALIGQAVAQVYLGELSHAQRGGGDRQARLFRAASVRLAAVGVAGALVLMVSAPALFPWMFGEPWRESGMMAQALAVSLALQLLASPLSLTLVVYERTGTQLAWDVGRLVLVTCSVLGASAAGAGVIACVWALSGSSAAAYALSWWLSRRLVTSPPQPRSAATT